MKFKVYFSAALIGLMALTACDGKEDSTYEPADPTAAGQRVYFEKSSETFEVQDNSASVTIYVSRPEAEIADAQTVELEATDPSGLFTVPATVTIPAGEVSAPVEITYNWEALVENEPYSIDIAVSEVNANEYAISSMKVTVTRSNWTQWAAYPSPYKGLGAYEFKFCFQGVEEPVLLTYRTNLNDSKSIQYRLNWLDDPDDETSWSTFMTFYTEDGGENITVPEQEFIEHPEYGMIYVSSLALFPGGEALATPSYFDPETGLMTLNVIYWDAEGLWGYGDEYFQLYGYESEDEEGDEEDEPASVRRHHRPLKKAGHISKTLEF